MFQKNSNKWLVMFSSLSAFILFAACNHMENLSPSVSDNTQAALLAKSGHGGGKGSGKSGGKDDDIECVGAEDSDLLFVRKRKKNEDGVSSAVIGPEGGVLLHADHRIEIPAGALTEPTLITFEMPVSDTLLFEFGPHGLKFLKPIHLILNYDHTCKSGLDESTFSVAYFNPDAQIWEWIPSTVDTELNIVDAGVDGFTYHFSRYALSRR